MFARITKTLLAIASVACAVSIYAASPSYDNFNSGDFVRSVNNIKLKGVLTNEVSGAKITAGTITTNAVDQPFRDLLDAGGGISLTDATNAARGVVALATNTIAATSLTGTIDDARIPSGVARDSETTAAIAAATNTIAAESLTGTIADARFPAVLPAISGANLTDLPSGTTYTNNSTLAAGQILGSGIGTNILGPLTNNTTGNAATATAATNIAPDSAVVNYVSRVGISATASNQITLWAKTLRDAGIFTNLVDAVFLRSNLNHGTLTSSQTFIRSNTVTLVDSSTMLYNSGGLYLPGSATQRAYWTQVPNTRTNTLLVQCRVWGRGIHNGNGVFAYWGGNIDSGMVYIQLDLSDTANAMRLVQRSDGGIFAGYSLYDRDSGNGNMTIRGDGWMRTFIFGHDPGIALTSQSDGVNNVINQTSNQLAVANSTFTQGHTNIQIGGFTANYGREQVQTWALFDKVLSQTEKEAAWTAWRYLDGVEENHITYGDSRSVHLSDNNELSWYGRLDAGAVSPEIPGGSGRFGNARFYDGGRYGSYVSNLLNDVFLTNILQWKAQGPVKKSTVWLLTDFNSVSEGAVTIWTQYSNTVVRLKSEGFYVKSVIPNLGNGQDAVLRVVHQYIRTNAAMFDEVIEFGQIVNETEFQDSYWNTGGPLHFSTNYARVASDWIASGYKRTAARQETKLAAATVTSGDFKWTNDFGFTRTAIVGGGTVTDIKIGTNTLGVTSGTFPIHHNEVLGISNSIVPTLLFTP